eukprot:gb/GECG01013348.1/.p1 GENE.gb/GECG01013348.1/~~gb/GECG01013348.1/.p1  ORF type:complete len:509 (+),score=52.45 gb/GECG01013348.1/:1-1527(+)
MSMTSLLRGVAGFQRRPPSRYFVVLCTKYLPLRPHTSREAIRGQRCIMASPAVGGRSSPFAYLFESEESPTTSSLPRQGQQENSHDTDRPSTEDKPPEGGPKGSHRAKRGKRKANSRRSSAGKKESGKVEEELDSKLAANLEQFQAKHKKGFTFKNPQRQMPPSQEVAAKDKANSVGTGHKGHIANTKPSHDSRSSHGLLAAQFDKGNVDELRSAREDHSRSTTPFAEVFNMRVAQGKNVEVVYTNSGDVVNEWTESRVFKKQETMLGLDMEWDNSMKMQRRLAKLDAKERSLIMPFDVIQIATQESVLVYHVSACDTLRRQFEGWKHAKSVQGGATDGVEIPSNLSRLFSSNRRYFVGIGIEHDCSKLKQLGLIDITYEDVEKDIEFSGASATGFQPRGLAKLARLLVGAKPWKSKSLALSSWAASPLRRNEVVYAARDAYYSLAVSYALRRHIEYMKHHRGDNNKKPGSQCDGTCYEYLRSGRFRRRAASSDMSNFKWIRENELVD